MDAEAEFLQEISEAIVELFQVVLARYTVLQAEYMTSRQVQALQTFLQKKAAEDARIDTARAEAAKPKQNRPDLDEDSTEILTYNEMKKKAEESEDPTSVLEACI